MVHRDHCDNVGCRNTDHLQEFHLSLREVSVSDNIREGTIDIDDIEIRLCPACLIAWTKQTFGDDCFKPGFTGEVKK